ILNDGESVMATAELAVDERVERLQTVIDRLGGIPLDRILMNPAPGTATEADLEALEDKGPICELIDGVLVEKAMGFYEARLGTVLCSMMDAHARNFDLGIVVGGD